MNPMKYSETEGTTKINYVTILTFFSQALAYVRYIYGNIFVYYSMRISILS